MDPSSIKEQVLQINDLIDGDQLNFGDPANPVAVGRTVSMVILGLIYLVWAWIPLLLIGVTGRVLLQGLTQRRETEQAIQRKPPERLQPEKPAIANREPAGPHRI